VCEERDRDYFGPVVNRAARLEAIAHGGQVLLSGTTAELLRGSLDGVASLRDLGQHRLKDLGLPEHVFQLEADFLDASFPPLSSLDNPELPNNLPCLLSAFIGREREVAEVRDLLQSSRLVTLTGAGGSGKTRLALQAAAELIGSTGDGVWFAELAPITDGGQIPAVVAAVLGLAERGGTAPSRSVADALDCQDALIVLDNCEHVIDDAAKFCEQIIRQCPKVRFLATSREPLGIDGERVYRVPSLSLPEQNAETAEDLATSDAVRLFAERARMQNPGFSLDGKSAPLIASICRRLDGIPLALELAAARLSSMSLAQVSDRLDQRFRLLTGGSRNAMPRQQTLQATVDWSFSLLTPAERGTLTRLSVFAGGFDLEAAENVCSTEDVDALDVMDLLGSLVDKSLVVAEQTAESVRYRLLETIRQYSAQELLRAAGDSEVLLLRDRHAAYYLELAETAEPATLGPGQGAWLRRLDTEWENLRAAFAHFQAEERPSDTLRLGVALQRFITSRGHNEVLTFLRPAVDQLADECSALVGKAMILVSAMIALFLRTELDQLPKAKLYAENALAIAEAIGDRWLEARSHMHIAGGAYFNHDLPAVARHAELAVAIARGTGDVQLLGEAIICLATAKTIDPAARLSGESRALHEEALACGRQSGDFMIAITAMHILYGLDLLIGHVDSAAAYLEQGVALADELGAEFHKYFLESDLGYLRIVQGRHEEAVELVRRSLLIARRTGLRIEVGQLLAGAAGAIAWQGDYVWAARMHGAADKDIAVSIEIGTIIWSDAEQQAREREQAKLKDLMGAEAYQEAYDLGAELTPAQAVELALQT
jgi:predicted ATPase